MLPTDPEHLRTQVVNQIDEIAALKAENARLRADLDAIIKLCYHPSEDDRGNWYYRIDVDPADGGELEKYDFDTEAEAAAAVRKCAGLKAGA